MSTEEGLICTKTKTVLVSWHGYTVFEFCLSSYLRSHLTGYYFWIRRLNSLLIGFKITVSPLQKTKTKIKTYKSHMSLFYRDVTELETISSNPTNKDQLETRLRYRLTIGLNFAQNVKSTLNSVRLKNTISGKLRTTSNMRDRTFNIKIYIIFFMSL